MKIFNMKFISAASALIINAFFTAQSYATTHEREVKWVGQFPKEQVQSVVDQFNLQYANLNIHLTYTESESELAKILSGDLSANFDLAHFKDADLLNQVANKDLVVPIQYTYGDKWDRSIIDGQDRWIPLLKRYRIIFYDSALVNPEEVTSYEDLGNSQFTNSLCLRQAKAQYNLGLYSFLLDSWGTKKFTMIMNQWGKNSEAIPLIEKDLDGVLSGIEKKLCRVGVANTYYYVRHIRANPNTTVKPMFPNQNDIGAHVNVDGVVVLKNSKNVLNSITLISFLLSNETQLKLSEQTGKFPANPNVHNPVLESLFGTQFKSGNFDINKITELKEQALEIAKRSGLK